MENKIPDFLMEMLENQYGKNITNNIIEAYQKQRKVTLRVNTIKTTNKKVEEKLIQLGIEFEKVPWSKEALIIKNANEKEIKKIDIYEKGEIYLQSLSSMLPPIILKPNAKENILDMAAAPGSKTTQIAALSKNEAIITACEINNIRAERLKYNIEKQGVTCTYVMVTDARNIDNFFSFDKILLDAPCSGSGTIRSNNVDIEKTFTKNLINKSTKNQIALLRKAIKILKPGKEMIYSTCSILECENEEIINKVLLENDIEIVPIQFEGTKDMPLLPVKINGTICICPNELYEGFFIAKIRKK